MSDYGNALGNDIARLLGMGCAILVVLPLLTFATGWYCGDRWEMPTIKIETSP